MLFVERQQKKINYKTLYMLLHLIIRDLVVSI